MGGANIGASLGTYLETHFSEGKYDLFAAFMLRGFDFVENKCLVAMVTMQSWMFTTRYQGFRNRLFGERSIVCLAHLDSMVMGIAFGTAASVWRTQNRPQEKAHFSFTATQDLDSDGSPLIFPPVNPRNCRASIADLSSIPERPVVYWASPTLRELFLRLPAVSGAIETREGLATADNERFVRNWYEVGSSSVQFDCAENIQAQRDGFRWFPYVKGGDFRRWFGNHHLIVDWEDDGERIRQNIDLRTGRVRSHNYNGEFAFRKGLTWSGLSSGGFSVRYVEGGCVLWAQARINR
jgi:hypothetical protein